MPDAPPIVDESTQRALIASIIEQAKLGGLKIRWHDADIVVIGILRESANKEISDG